MSNIRQHVLLKTTPIKKYKPRVTRGRRISKTIADKFLKKILRGKQVPIEAICTISEYKTSDIIIETNYYIVYNPAVNYECIIGKKIMHNLLFKEVKYVIIVNDDKYGYFIEQYLQLISYTSDEPFDIIIKNVKVPVEDETSLHQTADIMDEVCNYIEGISGLYEEL
jgi:hypothetical protein